jgi:hypothetical protein
LLNPTAILKFCQTKLVEVFLNAVTKRSFSGAFPPHSLFCVFYLQASPPQTKIHKMSSDKASIRAKIQVAPLNIQ